MSAGRVRARQGLELAGWLATAVTGLVMISQAIEWRGNRVVATVQSLTPFLTALMLPVAGAAAWQHRHRLGATAGLAGLGGVLLASPLVFAPGQPDPLPGATPLRAASVNLLYTNDRSSAIADDLLRRDLDLVVFNEYTAEHQATLLDHDLAAALPHRVDRDGLRAGGIAVWSRFPITEGSRPATVNYTIEVSVASPDGPIRVLAVHPPAPVTNYGGWERDLEIIGDLGAASDAPTLAIGDFNASYWHPGFRDLLKRGFVDAHMADGKGFSTSWPTDRFVPPFVQLDHALTRGGLVSLDVENFDIPGSDHRGLVVTVVRGR